MSSDPVESAAKGVAEAFLDWAPEKIKEYVQKFRHKDLAFVQDVETIEEALKQRKTTECAIFKQNIEDENLRICFLLGLTLRGMESDKEKCINLRNRILKTHGAYGLHVAQFVQNGIFAKFIGRYLEEALTPNQMKQEIENLFKNIELTNSFIQYVDDIGMEANKIVTRIQSHAPKTYVISGLGSVKENCREIADEVMYRISGYSRETYETELKIIIFLNRIES
ncbi:MAG: hypothetical protein ABSC20_12415 [Candidatus Bathyarchaeia archaeon]|jgi:hypothetical protein